MAPKPYFNAKGEVVPFAELMSLERIDRRTFRSRVKAYAPTGGENGAYGGHVYAQACWAAAQTVDDGMMLHNVTGWFTLGGIPTEHFVYTVHTIRNGGNYCVRSVTVTQIAEKGVCFTCSCSFKRAEAQVFRVQDNVDLKTRFKEAYSKSDMFEHGDMPSQDSWWFANEYAPKHPKHFNPLGGLHLRKVDMEGYNARREIIDRRSLAVYALRGSLPRIPEAMKKQKKPKYPKELNLHAIAHVFASDRNSLWAVGRHLGRSKSATRTATISHTVIFHVGIEDLIMANEPKVLPGHVAPTEQLPGQESDGRLDRSKWFMQEIWTDRAESGRGLHRSRMWDMNTGLHLATTIQDGLMRFKDKSSPKL